jgi:hypothetical protein
MIGIFIYFVYIWTPISYQDIEYSTAMHVFGWCISLFGLLQLPVWAGYAVMQGGGSLKSVSAEASSESNNFHFICFAAIQKCLSTVI